MEKDALLDGRAVHAGDVLIGIASSGAHANGYSLIRRILERAGEPWDLDLGGVRLADALLAPTTIYVKPMLKLLAELPPHAMAHITGGGLTENIIRVVPEALALELDAGAWPLPPLFAWLAEVGRLDDAELWRTFNCGIGFVLLVDAAAAAATGAWLQREGLQHWTIGSVVPARAGQPRVHIARR